MFARWWCILIIASAVVATLGCGCTASRNTTATRNYQAFITRYNVHYNGDKHYRETLEDMERYYSDDFSRMLFVHPAEARGITGVPQPTGDFTRSVEKAQKAIQLHSIRKRPGGSSATPQQREWKRRTEYNPFLHNSWLMLGRAEYMNGDFALAANTFLYISRHFKWLPDVVAEARTWEALCYCALGRLYEAENLLTKISADRLENHNTRQTYLMAKSSLLIRRKEYDKASETLAELIEMSHGKQKTRLRYLLGQILSRNGDKEGAYIAFRKIEGTLTTDYSTRFNARMAMSEVTPPEFTASEIKALEKMARYSTNADYLDQIYFAIGNLHISAYDTVAAEQAYVNAVNKSVRIGYDQAKARLALGSLQYAHGRYDLARINYNAALPQLPADHPGLDSISKHADALDMLGELMQTVILQDSLLKLARMSPHRQREIAERLARSYTPSMQPPKLSETTAMPGTTPSLTSQPTAAWYFYNPALIKSGKQQFRKIWGNRPLTDNWRISAKNSHTQSENVMISGKTDTLVHATTDSPLSGTSKQLQPDDPLYYLEAIPDTPERIMLAEATIEEATYNMGAILLNRLDDYTAASTVWSGLINRFPLSRYKLDVCESLFLIYSRMDDKENASRIRDIILTELPGTQLAEAIADPGYLEHKKEKLLLQKEVSSRAYNAYITNDNSTLHQIVSEYSKDNVAVLDNDVYPHLLFLDALAYAADGDTGSFSQSMKEIAENYSAHDLAPLAGNIISHLDSGRTPSTHSGNMVPVSISHSNEQNTITSNTESAENALFTLNPDTPQVVMLIYLQDNVSANALLYNIARYNFYTFAVRDFDLRPMSLKDYATLNVHGFKSLREAEQYTSQLYNNQDILPSQVRPVIISEQDLQILIHNDITVNHYLKFIDANRFRDAQATVLSTDIYEITDLEEDEP